MNYLKSAWSSASDPVRIAIVVVVGVAVIIGMFYGVDIAGLLGG